MSHQCFIYYVFFINVRVSYFIFNDYISFFSKNKRLIPKEVMF